MAAYLKKGIPSLYRSWQWEFGFNFRIKPDESLAYLQYRVLDSERNEIDLKEEKDMASSASKQNSRTKNFGKED